MLTPCSALAPMNLAPVLTFAMYTVIALFWKSETLLTAQAFTSVSLISLLTSPVVIFIQSLPNIVQCLGMFERIQEFCNDDRRSVNETKGFNEPIYMGELEQFTNADSRPLRVQDPIELNHLSFSWRKGGPPVLKDLSCRIQHGSFTAIVGSVGSGKSAFLRSLLGELIPFSSSSNGESSRQKILAEGAAYCAQQPWLENGTIYQNIIGKSAHDPTWYSTVKAASGLDIDLEKLPRADQTIVGSEGVNLSGGQKQRIVSAPCEPQSPS